MAHTIVGKLNKNASIFQAGESTGFGIRLGVKYYDRETQQNEWTNYEAAIFAKQPNQIQFYQNALVEGSVIEVSGDSLKIKSFDGQNGQQLSIEILNAKLGYVHTGQQSNNQQQYQQQQPQQQPQQQGGFNQQPQQQGGFAPQQQPQQQGGFAPQQNQNPQF
jgi:single-strand DNA-binding protein